MKAGTLSESGRIRPHLTPLECGIIFGGIPAGAISRKGGLIWGIPVGAKDLASKWVEMTLILGASIPVVRPLPTSVQNPGSWLVMRRK